MLGTCGEYIVTSTNDTDNLVDIIQKHELTLGVNPVWLYPFSIKKIGIKASAKCDISINGRKFTLEANEPLEFGFGVFDVTSIVSQTPNVKLTIRYLY
jgi:hypothetical protein